MENQLIQLYLLVCQLYDSQCSLKYQRLFEKEPRRRKHSAIRSDKETEEPGAKRES